MALGFSLGSWECQVRMRMQAVTLRSLSLGRARFIATMLSKHPYKLSRGRELELTRPL